MNKLIRIATRKSPLALWQAEFVKAELLRAHPELQVELLCMSTRGDKILDSPLAKIGGKGLFVKELEYAMLEGKADIAVHSMKDVPMEFPEGLALGPVCERENPCDAFVSNHFDSLEELPQGSRVGTSSLRRQCQLKAQRPDLEVISLRGNVNTRLSKLDAGNYDAIILASAGLIRLEMANRIRCHLSPEQSLPAGGQGAVGIELRTDDAQTAELISVLHHQPTAYRVEAERAMNLHLHGGCQVPIACYAVLEESDEGGEPQLWLRGLVGEPDGTEILVAQARGACADAAKLGVAVAEQLLAQGADRILKAVYGSADDSSNGKPE